MIISSLSAGVQHISVSFQPPWTRMIFLLSSIHYFDYLNNISFTFNFGKTVVNSNLYIFYRLINILFLLTISNPLLLLQIHHCVPVHGGYLVWVLASMCTSITLTFTIAPDARTRSSNQLVSLLDCCLFNYLSPNVLLIICPFTLFSHQTIHILWWL